MKRKLLRLATAHGHRVEQFEAIALAVESDVFAIGRESRAKIERRMRREPRGASAIGWSRPKISLPLERDRFTIRRKRWLVREADGLGRGERGEEEQEEFFHKRAHGTSGSG